MRPCQEYLVVADRQFEASSEFLALTDEITQRPWRVVKVDAERVASADRRTARGEGVLNEAGEIESRSDRAATLIELGMNNLVDFDRSLDEPRARLLLPIGREFPLLEECLFLFAKVLLEARQNLL